MCCSFPRFRFAPPLRHLFLLASALAWWVLGAGPAAAQSEEQVWGFETELGASVFFGNTEQIAFTSRGELSRADSTAEFTGSWIANYGEATDDEGDTFVNKRAWTLGSSVDIRPYSRVSPFFFGTLEYSLERRFDQRFSGGSGGKLTLLRRGPHRLDLSAAALAERTVPRGQPSSETEWLARWSVRGRARTALDEGRITLATENLYIPAFRDPADFTFRSTSSITFQFNNQVALKLTFVDTYDSGAVERGARTNNDGQLLVSLLARL